MPSSFCCVYRKYLSDYQTINELVWCSMKRLNFRLGTKVLQRLDIRKTGIHPNFWYPVARSDNVKTGKSNGVSFAGEPIVLVRTERGTVYALEDRCAHRQIPLHLGVVEKVIWALDLGRPKNEELRRYYAGRSFWRVKPAVSTSLSPY